MRIEVCCALNLYTHYTMQQQGKGRVLPVYTAKTIRSMMTNYFNHRSAPNLANLSYLSAILNTSDVPYKLGKKEAVPAINDIAVDLGDRLMLLYWRSKPSELGQWKVQAANLSGYMQEQFIASNSTTSRVLFDFCDRNYDNIAYLKVLGWKVYTDFQRETSIVPIDKSKLDPRLFRYQVEGVQKLCSGHRLLADDMGLGKTSQVLQFIQYKQISPVLICCPATLKLNWKKEILMWTDSTEDEITILSGTAQKTATNRFVIANYDILPFWVETLSNGVFKLAVCDECHYIQSEKAQRTQAFLQIKKHIPDTIFMSGTPFTSHPIQLYTALHCIAPRIFRNMKEYGDKFCNPTYVMGKIQYKGASNVDLLHSILMDGICIRRLKEDVLQDLPDKLRVTIPIGMTAEEVKENPVIYEQIVSLENKIAKANGVLGTIEYQRQITSLRKIGAANEWIRLFLNSGKKLVVFGIHTATLDAITSEFGKVSVRIDGSVSIQKRQEAVDKFQNNPECKLFIANIQCAATGLTLTAASDSLFVELPYCYSDVIQAEDRIYRIGQKNACTIWYATVPDSIDEALVKCINKKAQIHNRIFDGKDDVLFPSEVKQYKSMFAS